MKRIVKVKLRETKLIAKLFVRLVLYFLFCLLFSAKCIAAPSSVLIKKNNLILPSFEGYNLITESDTKQFQYFQKMMPMQAVLFGIYIPKNINLKHHQHIDEYIIIFSAIDFQDRLRIVNDWDIALSELANEGVNLYSPQANSASQMNLKKIDLISVEDIKDTNLRSIRKIDLIRYILEINSQERHYLRIVGSSFTSFRNGLVHVVIYKDYKTQDDVNSVQHKLNAITYKISALNTGNSPILHSNEATKMLEDETNYFRALIIYPYAFILLFIIFRCSPLSSILKSNSDNDAFKSGYNIKNIFILFFSLKGKISRINYFEVWLYNYLICSVIWLVCFKLINSIFFCRNCEQFVGLIYIFLLTGLILTLAVILISFATIKRIRDVGWSPKYALLLALPIIDILLIVILFFYPSHYSKKTQSN